jgi:hypothetical protein
MTGIPDFIGISDGKSGRVIEEETSQSTGLARCDSASDTVKTQVELELEDAISELEEQKKLEALSAGASEVTTKSNLMKPSALNMLRNIFVGPKSEPITTKDEDRKVVPSMATEHLKSMSGATPSKTRLSSTEVSSVRGSGPRSGLGSMQSTHIANTPRPMDIPSRKNDSATNWGSQSLANQYIKELDLHPCMEGDLEYGDGGGEDTNTNVFYHHRIALSAPPTGNNNRFEEVRSTYTGVATTLSPKPHDVVVDPSKVFYVNPSNIDDILAKRDSLVSDSLPRGIGRSHSLGPATQSLLTRTRSPAPNHIRGSLPNPRGRTHNSQQHPMHPQPQTTPVKGWDPKKYPLMDSMLRRNHTVHTPSSQMSSAGAVAGHHGISSTGKRQGNSPPFSSSIPVVGELNRAFSKWSHRRIHASVESSSKVGDRIQEGHPRGVSSANNTDQTYSSSPQDDSTKHQSGNNDRSSTMTTFSMFMPSRARAPKDSPIPEVDSMALQSTQPSPTTQANTYSTRYNANDDTYPVPPLPVPPKEDGRAVSHLPSTFAQATQDQDWTSARANESMDQHDNWQSYHTQRTWADILATDDIPISPETIKYDSYATYSPVSPLERESEVDQWTGSQEITLCYIPDGTDSVDSLQQQRRYSQDSKPMLWKGKHNAPADIVSDLRSETPVFPSSLPVRQREFLPQSPSDDHELSSGYNSPLSSQYSSSPESQYSQPTTPPNIFRQNPPPVAQSSLETIPPRRKPLQHAQTLPTICYTPPVRNPSHRKITIPSKQSLARPNLPQSSRTLPISFDTTKTQPGDASQLSNQPLRAQKVARDPFEAYKKGEESRWREAEERLKGKRDGRGGD